MKQRADEISTGIGAFPLFKPSNNLLGEAVIAAIRDDRSITVTILNTINHGFTKNVKKYKKAAREKVPQYIPYGEFGRILLSEADTILYFEEMASNRLNRIIADVNNRYQKELADHGPDDPVTIEVKAKLDMYEAAAVDIAIVDPSIVSFTFAEATHTDAFGLREFEKNHGLTDGIKYEGFLLQVSYVESDGLDITPAFASGTNEYDKKTTYEPELYPLHVVSHWVRLLDLNATYSDRTPSSEGYYGDLVKNGHSELHYSIVGLPEGNHHIDIVYNRDLPKDESSEEISLSSKELAVIPIRNEKKFLLEKNDPELYHAVDDTLSIIQVDIDEIQKGLAELKTEDGDNAIGDIDDTYILFFANMVSENPDIIRYNIRFYSTLSLFLEFGEFDPKVSYGPSFNDQAFHDAQRDRIEAGLPSSHEELDNFGHSTRYDTVMDIKLLSIIYKDHGIYTGIHFKTIGKIGTTSIYYYGEANDDTDRYGTYVDYTEQITKTTCRIVRVFEPYEKYTNFWSGEAARLATNYVNLSSADLTVLGLPVSSEVILSFTKLSETKIYFSTVTVFFSSVRVTHIPGWRVFLQFLLIIVIVVIAIITQQWELLIVLTAVTIIQAIVTTIVVRVVGEEEGGLAGVITGIVLTVLTLGIGGVKLLTSTIDLALAIISLATQLTQVVFTIQSYILFTDTQDLLEQIEESERVAKEKRDESGLDAATINPLMVISSLINPNITPQQMISRSTFITTNVMTDLTKNFAARAITLPELTIDPETREGYIPSYI